MVADFANLGFSLIVHGLFRIVQICAELWGGSGRQIFVGCSMVFVFETGCQLFLFWAVSAVAFVKWV